MLRSRMVGVVAVASCAMSLALHVPGVAWGADQPAEASWVALEDDASRASLFDDMVVPARVEADAKDPHRPVDLGIPKVFYFPGDARTDVIRGRPRENSIFGVDLSHFTKGNINLGMLRLQEVRFVYVKATQGVTFKDGLFGRFWSELHALETERAVSVGAYHFLTAGVDGKDQARRFLEYVQLHGGLGAGDMPPCLDLEWDRVPGDTDRWRSVSKEEAVENAVAWLEYVEQKTGRRPLLYTAKSWLDGRGITGELLERLTRYPMWIADYSNSHKAIEKPAVPAGAKTVLWQFSSDARLTAGYKDNMDANVFYGSEADFIRQFALPPSAAASPTATKSLD